MRYRFFAIFVFIFANFGTDSIFAQERYSSELNPGEYVVYKFNCAKGEVCGVSATFSPKHQREQGEAECNKFQLMSWADDNWINTAPGHFKYVEDSSGKEVLNCVAYTGYQGGKLGSKDRILTVQVTNGNIWKGLFELVRRRK